MLGIVGPQLAPAANCAHTLLPPSPCPPKAVAAAAAKAFLLPDVDVEACKRVWVLTLTDAICLYPGALHGGGGGGAGAMPEGEARSWKLGCVWTSF